MRISGTDECFFHAVGEDAATGRISWFGTDAEAVAVSRQEISVEPCARPLGGCKGRRCRTFVKSQNPGFDEVAGIAGLASRERGGGRKGVEQEKDKSAQHVIDFLPKRLQRRLPVYGAWFV